MTMPTIPAPARAGRRASGPVAKSKFRPEIQGLRSLAVLMVVSYHIWIGRVSGGVDVFLLISAFLMTLQFTGRYKQGRPMDLLRHWLHLFRRLLPAVVVVLLATLAATFTFLPPTRWVEVVHQAWASLFYFENWLLQGLAVNYYATDHSLASPLQHFWSLSIQGQVFILWPVIFATVAVLCRRFSPEVPGHSRLRFCDNFCRLPHLLRHLHGHQPGCGVLRYVCAPVGVRPGHVAGADSSGAELRQACPGHHGMGRCGSNAQLRRPAAGTDGIPRFCCPVAHFGCCCRDCRRPNREPFGRGQDPEFKIPGPAGRQLLCPLFVALAHPGDRPGMERQGSRRLAFRNGHHRFVAGAGIPDHQVSWKSRSGNGSGPRSSAAVRPSPSQPALPWRARRWWVSNTSRTWTSKQPRPQVVQRQPRRPRAVPDYVDLVSEAPRRCPLLSNFRQDWATLSGAVRGRRQTGATSSSRTSASRTAWGRTPQGNPGRGRLPLPAVAGRLGRPWPRQNTGGDCPADGADAISCRRTRMPMRVATIST